MTAKLPPWLPPPPRPLGAYARAARGGGLLLLSGMLPLREGRPAVVGCIGGDLDEARGVLAARLAAENAASALLAEIGSGPFLVLRLAVFLRTTAGFSRHAAIADGASHRLGELLGPRGAMHARSVIGVLSLPGGMPVELELTVGLGRAARRRGGAAVP